MEARTLSALYGAAVDVLIVSRQTKTWLGSMRPLLKIIALSGKENSGENVEKWQNNHQILSRCCCRGGRKTGQSRGGIVGEYLQIVGDGNSYSIEAPTGPPLSGDHQSKRNNLRVRRSQASKTPQDCHSPQRLKIPNINSPKYWQIPLQAAKMNILAIFCWGSKINTKPFQRDIWRRGAESIQYFNPRNYTNILPMVNIGKLKFVSSILCIFSGSRVRSVVQ